MKALNRTIGTADTVRFVSLMRCVVGLTFFAPAFSASSVETNTVYESTMGFRFNINPQYIKEIADLVSGVRTELKEAKAEGKLLGYLSVPISSKGGGSFEINTEIASFTAEEIGKHFGRSMFVLNPAKYSLGQIGTSPAGGGEYMAVWSDILGGSDGKGDVFDLVYFLGPADVKSYFHLKDKNILDRLAKWIDVRSSRDPKFRDYIAKGNNRLNFIRYYGLRVSGTYSKGSHDEWNIVATLNQKREIGSYIAVSFEGRAITPPEFEARVAPGNQLNQ